MELTLPADWEKLSWNKKLEFFKNNHSDLFTKDDKMKSDVPKEILQAYKDLIEFLFQPREGLR